MALRTTPYNPQPIIGVIKSQRRTVAIVARLAEVSYGHLREVVAGRIVPSEHLRTVLPAILNTPLEELFTPDRLERVYNPRKRVAA